jgi:hypothetical protein
MRAASTPALILAHLCGAGWQGALALGDAALVGQPILAAAAFQAALFALLSPPQLPSQEKVPTGSVKAVQAAWIEQVIDCQIFHRTPVRLYRITRLLALERRPQFRTPDLVPMLRRAVWKLN